MADIEEKATSLGELVDIINRRNPGSFTFWKSLAADLKGIDNLGEPLELDDEQVQALSIATGVTFGVIAFWMMSNPDVIKTFIEQIGKIASMFPKTPTSGGSA